MEKVGAVSGACNDCPYSQVLVRVASVPCQYHGRTAKCHKYL